MLCDLAMAGIGGDMLERGRSHFCSPLRGKGNLFGARSPGQPLASRPDVLVFETPPLDKPVTIAGNVSVRLFVSSDRPTTDFTAKLVDVCPANEDYPHGFAMNLCDGILRACYRDGFDRVAPLEPGRIVELVVPMYPIANLFETGHRIRLEISSSNFPRFDVNPNAAAGDDLNAALFAAVNSVHMGQIHPSAMRLSVM